MLNTSKSSIYDVVCPAAETPCQIAQMRERNERLKNTIVLFIQLNKTAQNTIQTTPCWSPCSKGCVYLKEMTHRQDSESNGFCAVSQKLQDTCAKYGCVSRSCPALQVQRPSPKHSAHTRPLLGFVIIFAEYGAISAVFIACSFRIGKNASVS